MSWRLAITTVCGVLASAAIGCGPISRDIPSSTPISVPGTGLIPTPEQAFPASLIGQALEQSINQTFSTAGYDKSHVTSLKLTQLDLSVDTPDEHGHQVRDLSFLSKLTVFLGDGKGTPIKVADSADGAFDSAPTSYKMPLTDAELADVFKKSDNLSMTSDVQPGTPPTFDTAVTVKSNVHVEISIF